MRGSEAARRQVQPLRMGARQPLAGAVRDAGAGPDRRLVVRQARPVGRPAVHLQGDGGAHGVAGRDRRGGVEAGHRAHRESGDDHRQLRVHPLVFACRRIAGDLHRARLDAFQRNPRALVPGAQEGRRHPRDAARRRGRPVLQRRIRRHLRQHLRADRQGLRLRGAEGLRRAHRAGTAARAGRRQGRPGRPAGREDLDRAVQHQARHARHPAGGGAAGAGGAERGDRGRLLRDRHRPRAAARQRRVRFGRGDPRVPDPRRRAHGAPRRHRHRAARLRRSGRAADALHGRGRDRHRGVDEGRRRHPQARRNARARIRAPAGHAAGRHAAAQGVRPAARR